MSNPVRGHVFLSYAWEDTTAVDELRHLLEAAGIKVWRDRVNLSPGDDWRMALRHAIADEALVFLACFSRASSGRPRSNQYEELVLAINQLRTRSPELPWLIPVRFDDSRIPDVDIGGGRTLQSIQSCDFFGVHKAEAAAQLIEVIRRVLGQDNDPHARWLGARRGTRRSRYADLSSRPGTADSGAGGFEALVISAVSDHGFANELVNSLLGLGAEIPLARVSVLDVRSEDAPPDSQAHALVQSADVILLVVSRDLLATEFGLSPDVRVLLKRHDSRDAVVFPVIFRATSWERQPFGRLVALPADGVPVAAWKSFDEAMRSITDSLRISIQEFLGRGSVASTQDVRTSPPGKTQNLGSVFKFTGVPELTFVEPNDFQVFRMALRQPGLGIVLEGPSGIGKTTILQHAVGQDTGYLGEVRLLSANRQTDVAEIEKLPDGHTGLVAVDDFHRLPGPLQDRVSEYLKALADDDATEKIVIVGIPGTAQNLVSLGPDLATRIWVLQPERVADSLVKEMIEKGEAALNIEFEAKSEIVFASKGSLQTAQMLCWQLASEAGVQATLTTTRRIPTDIARALGKVTETLSRKYQSVVDQFATLDQPAESQCINILLKLARTEDGVLRLDAFGQAHPEAREIIERVFVHGMPVGFCGERASLARHLYYDPRGRRLIADDPEFIFYLGQLNRTQLLEATGKKMSAIRDQVFVCYSHKDANWLDRLHTHLKPLERDHVIDVWSDQRLSLGADWRKRIDAALARARAALLLISADFLASDFIQEVELPQLLKAAEHEGCQIVPILVGPSLFFDIPDLERYQTANDTRTTLNEMRIEEAEQILLKVARWLKDLFVGPC